MVVLCACINLQTGEGLSADAVVGKHTLNSVFHSEFGLLFHQLLVLNRLQTADPTGVMIVILLLQLLAGENCLFSIDDDNEMISAFSIKVDISIPPIEFSVLPYRQNS